MLTVAVQNGLTGQQLRLVDMLRQRFSAIDDTAVDAFWRLRNRRLIAEWVPSFNASPVNRRLLAQADGMAMQAVDRAVIDWVEDYYISFDTNRAGFIPNINEQSRTLDCSQPVQPAAARGELD